MVIPGGELGIPTDRDQRSWVFLNNPKKYFATDRNPQKVLSGKRTQKIPSQDTFQVKYDLIMMKNCVY